MPVDNGVYFDSPLGEYFELSYAQFLTVPRLVLESMPQQWQEDMLKLLREMDETFDWRPTEGRYWVKLKDAQGRFAHAPLNDYRHGNIEHLRIKRNRRKVKARATSPDATNAPLISKQSAPCMASRENQHSLAVYLRGGGARTINLTDITFASSGQAE